MTRTRVLVAGRPYHISALGPQDPIHVLQAVVVAHLVDGQSGEPLRPPALMTTTLSGLQPRSTSDAVVGLVGRPSRAFPFLDTQDYEVPVRVTAPGYASRELTAVIPMGSPHSFAPVDLGALALHRTATLVQIATYSHDVIDGYDALPGADVRVSGHWPTTDRLGAPASTAPLLAVSPGLSAPRPLGATVDLPVLAAVAEPARVLSAPAAAGQTRLRVSTVGSLAPGDVAELDGGDRERAEWIEVVHVDPVAGPDSAGAVDLRHPVQLAHLEEATVRRVPPPPAAPNEGQLVQAALAGDRTLVLDGLGSVTTGRVVRVSGGAAPEYATAGLYRFTTDASGAGHLPPVNRLAALEITASTGTLSATSPLSLTPPTVTRLLDLTLR